MKSQSQNQNQLAIGEWKINLRGDGVWCREYGWLFYAEGGYKNERLSIFARGELFKADNWDDRIYVYERDVPGYFNVPARYGRGWNASLAGGLKLGGFPGSRHKINFRVGASGYPLSTEQKFKFEWRVQYVADF